MNINTNQKRFTKYTFSLVKNAQTSGSQRRPGRIPFLHLV